MFRRGATSQTESLPQIDDSCEKRKDVNGCRGVRYVAVGLLICLCTAGVLLRLPPPAPPLESEATRQLHSVASALGPALVQTGAETGVQAASVSTGGQTAPLQTAQASGSVNPVAPADGPPGHQDPPYHPNPLAEWGKHINGASPIVAIDPKFMYNRELSDALPEDRALPDSRPPGCIARNAAMDVAKLPHTTVVIVAYNEARSTLRRTVTSVLNHSPPELLDEIIIVDDHSEWDLTPYVAGMTKTRVIRNTKRDGLMIARINGFKAATAETVTFLDSHVECIAGWLPPLLQRVGMNSTTVISPVIDIIKEDTLTYVPAGAGMRGIFDWQLTFKWKPDDKVGQDAKPYSSPTHAGGLFTISKRFFEHIGLYDKGMHVWGYENIELSLRVWMCGGRLEIDPCSRVGHIFRSKSPLKFNGENYQLRNKLRTATVWLDDYARRVMQPSELKSDYGDISEQLALRKRLQCHSFQWYLDNVYPDHAVLSHVTTFKHLKANLCLDTMGKSEEGSEVGLYGCHGPDGNQRFQIDATEEGASKIKVDDFCLMPTEDLKRLILHSDCEGPRARWYTSDTQGEGHLRHASSDRCLHVSETLHKSLKMIDCNQKDVRSQWAWTCEGGTKTPGKGIKLEFGDHCVDSMARHSGEIASVWTCHHAGGNQAFVFHNWGHVPAGEKAPSDMPNAEAGLLMNTDQAVCLKVSTEAPVSGPGLKVAKGNRKVILAVCEECNGSPTASSADCVWWRHGSQLRSRSTQECLKLSKAQDSADLEAESCGVADKNLQSWDSSIPTFGLCHGDGQ